MMFEIWNILKLWTDGFYRDSDHLRSRTIALHLQSGKSRRFLFLHLNLRCHAVAETMWNISPSLCAPVERNGNVVVEEGHFSPQRSTSDQCPPENLELCQNALIFRVWNSFQIFQQRKSRHFDARFNETERRTSSGHMSRSWARLCLSFSIWFFCHPPCNWIKLAWRTSKVAELLRLSGTPNWTHGTSTWVVTASSSPTSLSTCPCQEAGSMTSRQWQSSGNATLCSH